MRGFPAGRDAAVPEAGKGRVEEAATHRGRSGCRRTSRRETWCSVLGVGLSVKAFRKKCSPLGFPVGSNFGAEAFFARDSG